jgi:hypothetical protein
MIEAHATRDITHSELIHHLLLLFIHYTDIIQKESFLVNPVGQCALTWFLQPVARVTLILGAHPMAGRAIAVIFCHPVAHWDLGYLFLHDRAIIQKESFLVNRCNTMVITVDLLRACLVKYCYATTLQDHIDQ